MKMIKVVKKLFAEFGIKDYTFVFNPPPNECGYQADYWICSPLIGNFSIDKGETYDDIKYRLYNLIDEIQENEFLNSLLQK